MGQAWPAVSSRLSVTLGSAQQQRTALAKVMPFLKSPWRSQHMGPGGRKRNPGKTCQIRNVLAPSKWKTSDRILKLCGNKGSKTPGEYLWALGAAYSKPRGTTLAHRACDTKGSQLQVRPKAGNRLCDRSGLQGEQPDHLDHSQASLLEASAQETMPHGAPGQSQWENHNSGSWASEARPCPLQHMPLENTLKCVLRGLQKWSPRP